MFLEDVYILTWETDVNIKEKGCVSTKLKVSRATPARSSA